MTEDIAMRTTFAFVVSVLIPVATFAAPPEKFHYLGEIKLSGPAGKALGSQVILVKKTLDRDKATYTEEAIVIKADGTVEQYSVPMIVKDDNTFTINDEAKGITGEGKLFGSAWKWTYFKATFKVKNNGITVDDENFMADDSVGSARKKISGPDGRVLFYMDMSLKAITPQTFEILKIGLSKKK